MLRCGIKLERLQILKSRVRQVEFIKVPMVVIHGNKSIHQVLDFQMVMVWVELV